MRGELHTEWSLLSSGYARVKPSDRGFPLRDIITSSLILFQNEGALQLQTNRFV